jgi:universal stress protein A
MKLLIGSDLSPASYRIIQSLCDRRLSDFEEIVLAHIIELDPYTAGGSFPMLEAADKDILAGFAADIRRMGIDVKIEVREGEVADQINAIARENSVDMIGVTNIGGGLTEKLLGSTAEKLASKAELPILIEKGIAGGHTFGKVLCAVDFSESSANAVKYASRLPGLKELTLINVAAADDVDAAKERMDELLRSIAPKAEGLVLVGRPAQEILDYAGKNRISCIAAGLCGHSGLQRTVWGSTSAEIARYAAVPVLLIPFS